MPSPGRVIPILALLALVGLLAACSLHPGRGVKSCRYWFQALSFTGLDSQATHWKLNVAVVNPNSREVSLTRMHYALMYQADTLLTGWNPEKRVLAPGDSQLIETTIDLPNALWKRLPGDIWSQTDAKFLVVADAYVTTWVGDILVPHAIKETVHINMTEQVARYRDMVMKRFFGWPGQHLSDGGIAAPDSSAPRDVSPPPGGTPPNGHF